MKFKLLNSKRFRSQLELISIHIPKTAGRTFLTALGDVYGNQVIPANKLPEWKPGFEMDRTIVKKIPSHIRCVHGHFYYSQMQNIHLTNSARLITWFRDPVERVVSNYFYDQKDRISRLSEIRNPIDCTLTYQEYIFQKSKQNVMHKRIKGAELEVFDFIGDIANFNDDLKVLCDILGWKQIPNFKNENVNSNFKESKLCKTNVITKELVELTKEYNYKDIILYERFKELRKNGYYEDKRKRNYDKKA